MPALKRRVVIATAGHVDHGKTTLVQALTGTDTDRLPDEKRRGISIELGFATLKDAPLSFIDVPGHKKLVHAMIAGVGGVDGVLLVVAADDAVMPQTWEHLHVCKLLGIDRMVVALSKSDLVDDETLELAKADLESTLQSMGMAPHAIIASSVPSGLGVAELKSALLDLAANTPAPADDPRAWLPVDRVFSVRGAGTVITGTLTRGSLSVGQAVFVGTRSGVVESSCRSIEVHGAATESVQAPSRVAINLAKLELASVKRGSVVSTDPALPITRRLEVQLQTVSGAEEELSDGSSAQVYVGTTRRTGRVTRLGDGGAHIALDAPLPALGGVGFVLRGFRDSRQRGAVLGGGTIVDASPARLPRRRDAARWDNRIKTLEALAQGRPGDALVGLVTGTTPRAVFVPALEPRLGRPPGELTKLVEGKRKKGGLFVLPDGLHVTTQENMDALAKRLIARVDAHHHSAPHEPGLSLETARSDLARIAGRALADAVIERARARNQIVVDQAMVCTPQFAKTSGPAAREAENRALAELEAVGLDGTTETALGMRLGDDVERLESRCRHWLADNVRGV